MNGHSGFWKLFTGMPGSRSWLDDSTPSTFWYTWKTCIIMMCFHHKLWLLSVVGLITLKAWLQSQGQITVPQLICLCSSWLFSWGDENKHLSIPDRALETDWRNNSTQVLVNQWVYRSGLQKHWWGPLIGLWVTGSFFLSRLILLSELCQLWSLMSLPSGGRVSFLREEL